MSEQSEQSAKGVKKQDVVDAIFDAEVLGFIQKVGRDMGIVEEGTALDKNSIRETVLKALATQGLISKQLNKTGTRLYIETPNKERVYVKKKDQSS